MNERIKESERNWRMFERNLRMVVLQRMNLFLCYEEWIKLQHNLKPTVETKIILNLPLTQSLMILLWMLFRILSLDAFIILLWNCWIGCWKDLVNSLSINPTKWSNTVKKFVSFFSFHCCCYIKKAWLFALPSLLFFMHQRQVINMWLSKDSNILNFIQIYLYVHE